MQEMLPIQSHSLNFLTLIAYLLKHWKPTKACQTTTMQSIWCNFVTQSLFGTLNYWTSEVRLRCGNLACSNKFSGQGVHVYFRKSKSKFKFVRLFKPDAVLFALVHDFPLYFFVFITLGVCYEYNSTKVCFWILSPSFPPQTLVCLN
jgi:hypothetical protein